MAELTRPGAGARNAADPRAVRARLAEESRGVDDPVLRVSPGTPPLQMANPTVGTGPLGGIAIARDEAPDGGPVSAQRHLLVDDAPADVSLQWLGGERYRLEDGVGSTLVVMGPVAGARGGIRTREVLVDGFRFVVELESERVAALRERASVGRASAAHAGPLQVKAIIPGKVVAVSVAAGDAVTAGQQLLVVEAMKMQNELRAPRDGTIERIAAAVGVNIEIGDLLVVIS